MMERETAVAFDALIAMPDVLRRVSAGLLMLGFLGAAFASAAAAFASRFALRSARTVSALSSSSVFGRAWFGRSGGLVIVPFQGMSV
ncbi:MAG TPA: hypothetical protein VFZ73_14360 [Gemmatimonadaceae bacterium]